MKLSRLRLLVIWTALIAGGLVWAAEDRDPHQIIEAAKQDARTIPGQAQALAELAWPDVGRPDVEVSPLARLQLVNFGKYGLPALRQALRRVDVVWTADITAAIIEASLTMTEGRPIGLIPTLEDVLWYGSADAKRLAIPELAKRRFRPALMACADAIFDHPEIASVVIESLGDYRLDKARHTLAHVLQNGDAEHRRLAADALARIGGRSLETLRDASLSPNVETRELAMEAFLTVSGPNDLTALYEYIASYPDDDPALREKIVVRAQQFEALLEQRQAADAASPDLEDY